MALREDIQKQGEFLFRWRSYLPLLALPIFLVALKNSGAVERAYGTTAASIWQIYCIAISFCGLAIRCLVAGSVPRGTSGRNTMGQLADALNTTGMYSLTRNPLYLGNFVIVLGLLLFIQVWWLLLVAVLGFLSYYALIIFAEEEFLREKFKQTFLDWAKKTPAFLPRFKNWKKPALPFSWKTMLRREHSTLISTIAAFTFIHFLADLFTYGKIRLEAGWIIFFLAGLATYFSLLILKKKTKILDVAGR